MAREDHLAWPSLDDLTMAVQHFLDPVLAGSVSAMWDPFTWTWKTQ